MLGVAELVNEDPDEALPSVAGALAVLAGIAASDAPCCASLHRRPRGQAHGEAVRLLEKVMPGGPKMSTDLTRLLAAKDQSHYGLSLMTAAQAKELIKTARRLEVAARRGG